MICLGVAAYALLHNAHALHAGFGDKVDLLEPDELREEELQTAKAMVRAYRQRK